MHLKSLTLKGFKSFADRCVLSLEPGITAVVGPNGSGKSNISDAVLWVLGERNAKNLRGQAMEDVIFAGSSARKSVSVAEVELVLDNSDGTLPVDFAEVSLTRRMYRSGESEYLINGAPARRRDFMDILHDTGLGAGTHSIISQGNLDAILASKPEDRRALIEDAAGVLKHKQRKERATRKLTSMDANLARAKDVCAEVERQLKPLARKAARAQARAGVEAELAELELVLAVDDLRRLQGLWRDCERSEKEAAAAIDVENIHVRDANAHLEQLQLALQERGLYVGDLTAQRGRFHMVVERLESADLLLGEKGHSIETRLSQARDTMESSERRITSYAQLADQLQGALDEQTARRDTLARDVEELSASYAKAHERRLALDAELSQTQAAQREREREADAAAAKHARLTDGISGRTASKRLLESRRDETAAQLSAAASEFEESCRGLEAEAQALAQLADEVSAANKSLADAEKETARAREALEARRAEVRDMRARIAALEELNRAMRTKDAASAWVAEHGAEFDAAIAPIAAEIHAPERLEGLVERLLGDDLASLYVRDAAAAGKLVAAARKSGAEGQVNVLIANGMAGVPTYIPDGDRLVDHLEFSSRVEGIVERLLGDVVLVDSVDEALSMPQDAGASVRYATRDGVLVWPQVKVSAHMGASDEESMLARERELSSLRVAAARADASIAKAERARVAADEALEARRAETLELSRAQAQRTGAHSSAEAERERLAKRVSSLTAESETIAADLEHTTAELAEIEPELASLKAAIDEARAAAAELEAHAADLAALREKAYEAEQSLQSRLADAKLEYATARERARSLEREHAERARDLERAQAARERALRDEATLSRAAGRVAPLHDVLARLKTSAAAWVEDLAGKAALEQSNSESLNASITDAREAVRTANAALDAARGALSEVRVEKGRLEVQVDSAIATIVDDCHTPLETALDTPEPDDRAAVEAKVFKLRRRLDSMGSIDSSAAEEYAAMKERYDYMAAQVADVEEARRALKRIVNAIDARMQQQFDTTFAQVNANFQDIFSQLFPGGAASLELVGGEEGAQAGVEVHAQPRGKRITKMTLMSGGEKSLTALALLFAVYRIRNAPFYILDEVEAALDDSNLQRLIVYLDGLRAETQLIMITHQRRTMEMADVLYGVSMQADGVTKVISQRLEDATRAVS